MFGALGFMLAIVLMAGVRERLETSDIPVYTREEARESRPHPEEPRFRLLLESRDPFPAWSGKNSRRCRRISRGGALHKIGRAHV